ncbi:MAG: transporter substrate-binding domain-containing protein [Oligoflexia bacterium]|nr:transporter substrate-binding domain-containing protein [Oligoflexia bacterium]
MLLFAICCCTFYAFVANAAETTTTPKVTIAAQDLMPWLSPQLENKGLYANIVTTAFKEVGVEVEIIFAPWARAMKLVLEGEIFALMPAFSTPEREKLFFFSDAFSQESNAFYYYGPIRDFKYKGLEDLKGYLIGGTSGYYYTQLFNDAGLRVDYTNSDINNFKKLSKRYIDFFFYSEIPAAYIISTHFPKEKEHFHIIENSRRLFDNKLMVSKKYKDSQELLRLFNQGLSQIKENGKYQALLSKHHD